MKDHKREVWFSMQLLADLYAIFWMSQCISRCRWGALPTARASSCDVGILRPSCLGEGCIAGEKCHPERLPAWCRMPIGDTSETVLSVAKRCRAIELNVCFAEESKATPIGAEGYVTRCRSTAKAYLRWSTLLCQHPKSTVSNNCQAQRKA